MIRTLDLYIIRTLVRNMVLSILGLGFTFFTQQLFVELFDHAYPSHQVLVHNLLNVPQVLVQMSPPAVLLATVITLSGLARTNELVACYSIGVGLNRIVMLVLTVVFGLTCTILVAEDRVLPSLFRKRNGYFWREMKRQPDFFLDVKKDKIWYRSRNLIYNLRRFDTKTKTIHGMSVYTFGDDFNLLQVLNAEKAEYTPQGWKLKKGTVTVFSPDDPFPLTKDFQEKELVIAESPTDFQEIDKEVDGLRFGELYQYIQRLKTAGADTKAYQVKFHSRISLSFIPIVMCCLAIPFAMGGRREGGLAKDLGACFAITFFYWLFYSVGLSLGTNGALPPWLAAWLPSAIFAAWAVALIARKK